MLRKAAKEILKSGDRIELKRVKHRFIRRNRRSYLLFFILKKLRRFLNAQLCSKTNIAIDTLDARDICSFVANKT